jgi:hypothetical protein
MCEHATICPKLQKFKQPHTIETMKKHGIC